MAIIQGIFTEKQILPYEAWTNNPDFLFEAGEYFVDNYLKAEGVTGGIAYVKATDGKLFFNYDTTTTLEDLETFNHSMYFIYSMATGFDNAPENRITSNPEEWQNSNKLILDWINLYQKDDGLHILTCLNAN